MPLVERVLATIRKHGLVQPGTRVVAAVSGGADSVALALALGALAPSHDFTLAGLAHLHHGLRGAEADADERHVAALASRLGVPLISARENVAVLAAEAGESVEAAARRARYAFLERAASELGAGVVATGHTADDQAETLMLRLMRGAGLQGLSAIRPRNRNVIRPLLDVRRTEVERYLRESGETWREDASNADRAIARNRVRHEVMPALKQAGGEAVVDALARTAALIQDDAEELERQAIEMARRDVLLDDSGTRLSIPALERAGAALGRRIVRRALEGSAGGRFQSLEHVEAVRSLIRGDSPAAVQVPGAVARREGAAIRIEPDRRLDADGAVFEARLPVPGEVALPVGGLVVSAGHGRVGADSAPPLGPLGATGHQVALQGVDASFLVVRNRRPGDAIRPLGAPGRRKVQDVFVDRKVPRHERDRVPLVVDDRGRILWVVGHTIADEFRVTSPGARVLLLTVRRAVGDYI